MLSAKGTSAGHPAHKTEYDELAELSRVRTDEVLAIDDPRQRHKAAKQLEAEWLSDSCELRLEDQERLAASFAVQAQDLLTDRIRAFDAVAARRKTIADEAARDASSYRSVKIFDIETQSVAVPEGRGGRMPSAPATRIKDKHWTPSRQPPASGGGRASIDTGLSFVKSMRRWIESEAFDFLSEKGDPVPRGSIKDRLANPETRRTFSNEPGFINLFEELKEISVLESVLLELKKEVGPAEIVEFPKGRSLLEMVRALANAGFSERSLLMRMYRRPSRDIPTVLAWWKEEFRVADNIEAHVLATLANPSGGLLPRTNMAVLDYSQRSFRVPDKENGGLLANTLTRIDVAARTITLCHDEIVRCWWPRQLRCDPTNADDVAAELMVRTLRDEQSFGGVGRYLDDISCAGLILGPMTLHAIGMVVLKHREIGDALLIAQAVGWSSHVIAAVAACALACGTALLLRRRALKNRVVRAWRWGATSALGLFAWVSVMMIQTLVLPPGTTGRGQELGGSLVYVKSLSTPRVRTNGRIIVAEVLMLRGPLVGTLVDASQDDLDKL